MFQVSATNFGCCGYTFNNDLFPVSILGYVDSKEEEEEFLALCKKQVSYIPDTYDATLPVYWSFKLPGKELWMVSYQIQQPILYFNDIYSLRKGVVKKLKKNKEFGDVYWTIETSFSEKGLEKYNKINGSAPNLIKSIQGFSTYRWDAFLQCKANSGGGASSLFMCVFHALGHSTVQSNIEKLRNTYDVLFEQEWHNPSYLFLDPKNPSSKADSHNLLTVIFQEKGNAKS